MRLLAFLAGVIIFGAALLRGLLHNDANLETIVNVPVPLLQSYAIPILFFGFPLLVMIIIYAMQKNDEEQHSDHLQNP